MRNRTRLLILLLMVIVVLAAGWALSRQVLAQPLVNNDDIIVTPEYILNGVMNQALVVMADRIDVRGDSRVEGDASLIARERARLDGYVSGDVTLMGSSVELGRAAQVAGDATLIGGEITLDGRVEGVLTAIGERVIIRPGARLAGAVTACGAQVTDQRVGAEPVGPCSEKGVLALLQQVEAGDVARSALEAARFTPGGLLITASSSLFLAGLAALAVTLFPRRFNNLSAALQAAPGRLTGMGCLSLIVVFALLWVILLVSAVIPVLAFLWLPLAIFLTLLFIGVSLAGWIALAQLCGKWLLSRFAGSVSLPPLVSATMGSLLLLLIGHLLALLPGGGLAGALVIIIAGLMGLGAGFTTRLGSRAITSRPALPA